MKYAKLCTLKLLYDPKEKVSFFKFFRHNNVRIVNKQMHKITHKQLFIILNAVSFFFVSPCLRGISLFFVIKEISPIHIYRIYCVQIRYTLYITYL